MLRRILMVAAGALATAAMAQKAETRPHQDQVRLLISKDGQKFEAEGQAIFDHASCPEVLRLDKDLGELAAGSYVMFFVDFSEATDQPHTERLARSLSADGLNWGPREPLRFSEERWAHRAGDPSLVQLDDGRIRVYFLTPGSRGKPDIRSAISADGLNFEIEEGLRIEGTAGTAEVVRLGERWTMIIGSDREQQCRVFQSADGLQFEATDHVFAGAGAGILAGATVERVFVHERGLAAYDGLSDGRTYRARNLRFGAPPGITGAPSPYKLGDGRIVLAYKYQSMVAHPPRP